MKDDNKFNGLILHPHLPRPLSLNEIRTGKGNS